MLAQSASPEATIVDGTDAQATLPIWTSITSMVLGILITLAYLADESEYFTYSELFVWLLISVVAITLAGVSINKKHRGKGMAIAGLVMGILGALLSLF